MLFWYCWILTPFDNRGIFVKASYVAGSFLVAVCCKGKFGFCLWNLKMQVWRSFITFSSILCIPLTLSPLLPSPLSFSISFRLPTSVSVLLFCLLSSSLWVFFFCFPSKFVKGKSFIRFSWKKNCFSSFKCSSCMISVWGLGLWSKCCSFKGFLMKREDLYLVSRFRVLRKTFICMIFVKGLRFWERRDVLCVGGKMIISIGLRIDWVWKHMKASTQWLSMA